MSSALARCRTGKISPTSASQCGKIETATNTPEMKYSGSRSAWVTGCAVSSLRMSEVSA